MTKKAEDLQKRIKRLKIDKDTFIKSAYPVNFKSAYVSCDGCGSKIRKDLYKGLKCPACGTEKLSDTSKERIKSFDQRIKDAEKQLRVEMTKKGRSEKVLADFDNLKLFKITQTFDVGYDVFWDTAYVIPIWKNAKQGDVLRESYGEKFPDSDLPYILLEHQEEKYGNDTYGWNADLHYRDGNCTNCNYYTTRYICGKEFDVNVALRKVKSFCRENAKWLEEQLSIACKLAKKAS